MENKKSMKSKIDLKEIRSDNILKLILKILPYKKLLQFAKYNKRLLNILELNINDYKEFSDMIVIEIIPGQYSSGFIFNYNDYHPEIFCNDNKTKFSLIFNNEIQSFEGLFKNCDIESINFKKFYRKNITNMKEMFYGCKSLKELNLSKFNTENVTDMRN